MLFRDPPDHTRLRALVNRAFTPRVIEGMRGQIQAVVDRLLDRVERRGHMDIIADLAYPLPVTVICDMLGVPVGDHEQMRDWSSDIIRSLDAIGIPSDDSVVERGRVGAGASPDFARSCPSGAGSAPISFFLIAAEEQATGSPRASYSRPALLFIAGHETTVNLIGNGLLALLRLFMSSTPRAEPGLMARRKSCCASTALCAPPDHERGGGGGWQDPAGSAFVVTAIGAANRDPRHFADPDRLDIGRTENRHIAFGFGIHFCLGAPLARVEGQLALGALMRRMPKLRLAGPELEWRESSTLRGLKALPVEF
jgi:cytochrome P450